MEIEKLLSTIKEEFPNKAIDISESLILLKETINDTMEAINNKMSIAYSNRDFVAGERYLNLGKEINQYEIKIDDIINHLEVEEIEIEEETTEETEKRIIPNYEEYTLDRNVEHTLYENFTHMRPCGFKLNDNKIVEVNSFQEMLIKTSEFLIAADKEKFMKFQNKSNMNGKKMKYFSVNKNDMRKPKSVSGLIYIETNMSGNSIRNLIIKMLKEYGFRISDYKIYFRADYSNINNE